MNRSTYYDYIEDKLLCLALKITYRWKLNLLNLNVHSENFYRDFLNILYWYKLENANQSSHNVEAIDLIDRDSKVIMQVSSTATKQKIEKSLSNNIMENYKSEWYSFYFIPLVSDIWNLKNASIQNKHWISFIPKDNIISIKDILEIILYLDINNQKKICDFIKKELWNMQYDIELQPTNLAEVIAKIWEQKFIGYKIEKFQLIEIEKKISFNNLGETTKQIIEEYKIYSNHINEIYNEYDKTGKNKTMSVLYTIKDIYLRKAKEFEVNNIQDTDLLFFAICDEMKNYIKNSSNYNEIPAEELTLIINIILVDAFIKCKIFKKPN